MPAASIARPDVHGHPGSGRSRRGTRPRGSGRSRRGTRPRGSGRSRWSTLPRRCALAFATALLLGAGERPQGELPADLRRIEKTGLELARTTLARSRTLTPFAFVIRSDGRTQRVSPAKKRGRYREDALESLLAGLRARTRSGDYEAVAIFSYVVISLPDGEEVTAIHVGIEDGRGHCAESFVPYRSTGEGELELDPAIHRPREPLVFPGCDPAEPPTPPGP